MAVYTHLSSHELAALIAEYDVGALVSAKGIAEGVSNSNWLIETTGPAGTGARFILTMYERRIEPAELPFFLGLLDHLSAARCPVPRTIHDRNGASYRLIGDKAVALIEFLPGVSIDRPTPAQARSVGAALAEMHKAASSFPLDRANRLDIAASRQTLERCGTHGLAGIDPALPDMIGTAAELQDRWPQDLPRSICHTDLFPDNVLMLGEAVTGLIDFYFACREAMAYDLAVTHAAWSFEPGGHRFRQEIGDALIAGYEGVRPLQAQERKMLPLLAQGACLRFVASRAEDWIDTPADAHVTRKDPLDFVRRRDCYVRYGAGAFA